MHGPGCKVHRLLAQGEYTVFYESDGSHSFDNWNSDPPSDPTSYGVTIFAVN